MDKRLADHEPHDLDDDEQRLERELAQPSDIDRLRVVAQPVSLSFDQNTQW